MVSYRLSATAVAAGLAIAGFAPIALAEDAHHPPGAAEQTAPAPAPSAAPQTGPGMMGAQATMGPGMMMGGQGMAGAQATMDPGMMMGPCMMMGGQGMSGGHGMMGMMGGQGMMAMMSGMGMTEHVEGRIAFLQAELKITSDQQEAWSTFAEAIRANAKKMGEMRAPGMTGGPATLQQRFDQQEKQLAARLDGLRGLKTAYDRLAAVLNDEQKGLAERLIPPHVGIMGGRMM